MAYKPQLDNDPTKLKIESHSSQLTNLCVIEQLGLAVSSGIHARRTLTFDNIRNYYTEINALWIYSFSAIRNPKWSEKVNDLRGKFEGEEMKIIAGIVEPTKMEMIVLYKVSELILQTIIVALQELGFFYRMDLSERKGLDMLEHIDTLNILRKKKEEVKEKLIDGAGAEQPTAIN